MKKFVIIADSSCDLTKEYREEHKIDYAKMMINWTDEKGENHDDIADIDWQVLSAKDFYDIIRSGIRIYTAQVTMQNYLDTFEPHLKAGEDILYLACSSGLSASLKTAQALVDNELKEKYMQADLGNGKIDKKAIQKAGNCWLHGNITALASNEAGEKFLENNIVKDDEKHIFAVFLQEAKDKKLPAPNGDGIYLFTEKEVLQAQIGENALSFGDGDITAYALAADRLLKETGEKMDSESGNHSFTTDLLTVP